MTKPKKTSKKAAVHSADGPVSAAAEQEREAEQRLEDESVESVRQKLRADRARAREEDKVRRVKLRQAFSKRTVDELLDIAVTMSLECDRLRAEVHDLANARDADGEKVWRSQHAYVRALATELDSQRSRCEELQAQVADMGRQYHAHEQAETDRITEAIGMEKAKFDLEQKRCEAALALSENKTARLGQNLLTLLDNVKLVGRG